MMPGVLSKKWTIVISTGFFLAFVLYVYRAYDIPQGTSLSGHSLLIRTILLGLATSFVFFINEFLFIGYVSNKWRQSKAFILYRSLWELWMGAGVTFLLYNYFWNWNDLALFSYLKMNAEYAGIVGIPLALIHLGIFRKSKEAETMPDPRLALPSRTVKEKITLIPEDILYLKAEGNYVQVAWLANGQVKSKLIRSTLKEMISSLEGNLQFLQVHRSYIVNKLHITESRLTQSGAYVKVKDGSKIPVTQKYLGCLQE
jgi:hypothetical protein